MSEHFPKICIIDALDAIETILEFSKNIDFDTYMNNRKTRDAIYRNIEVLGETVDRMPQYFLVNHPEIPRRRCFLRVMPLLTGMIKSMIK